MSNIVEGVTWELSGTLYQLIYPLAYAALEVINDVRQFFAGTRAERPPPTIIHVGIIYQGHLYEYLDQGVKKTVATDKGDPGSVCDVDKFLQREVLGRSKKSRREFDSWVAQQKEGKFAKENYCVAYNQCVHFAITAANFLEVEHPPHWDKMCKFTESNPNVSGAANRITRSSASTSTASGSNT